MRTQVLRAEVGRVETPREGIAGGKDETGEVMRWDLGDRNRMADVEAIVVEHNVAEFVLARAQVTEKSLPLDELMAQS